MGVGARYGDVCEDGVEFLHVLAIAVRRCSGCRLEARPIFRIVAGQARARNTFPIMCLVKLTFQRLLAPTK